MCVTGITESFLPWNTKPSSIAATVSLVCAVATAALAIMAYGFHWGTPALCTLASISTVMSVVTIALVACKKRPEPKIPLVHALDPGVSEPTSNGYRKLLIAQQLLPYIQNFKLKEFQDAIKIYTPLDFTEICTSKWLEGNISLIDAIFAMQNERHKFLTACLSSVTDHSIGLLADQVDKCAQMEDRPLVALLVDKLDYDSSFKQILPKVLKYSQGHIWIDGFLRKNWDEYSCYNWAERIIYSKFPAYEKVLLLELIASCADTTLFEYTYTLNYSVPGSNSSIQFRATFLHQAIINQDLDLVLSLLARTKNENKDLNKVTPEYVLLAIQTKNAALILGLLRYLNPYFIADASSKVLFPQLREGATRFTSWMVAQALGYTDVSSMLWFSMSTVKQTEAENFKDHPDDPAAWTANDYALAFKNKQQQVEQ